MEDITSRINQILSDPQSVQMLQSMAQNLGLGGPAPEQQPSAPLMVPPLDPSPVSPSLSAGAAPPAGNGGIDMNQLSALLGQFGLGKNQPQSPPAPAIDMNSLLQIQKAMQLFTQGNKNVDLLRSLRPLLSEQRQKKVDDAIRIMQLIQMLPMLKESGLFGALGGGGGR